MLKLDGRVFAKERQVGLQSKGAELHKRLSRPVCLAVILVGDDPASRVYVGAKVKACREVGIESREHRLPCSATAQDMAKLIDQLNRDHSVDGILLQLPLPQPIHTHSLLEQISPLKDVDGLHSANMGKLLQGRQIVAPCTPSGVIELLKRHQIPITGRHAVVVGRSEIVGKPMAQLLLQENATVTICHSKTPNLRDWSQRADILVVAAGRPEFLTWQDIKKGATLVDVGIHRKVDGQLCGDVTQAGLAEHVFAFTPVPGGVGPMTISMLLQNTLKLAEQGLKEKSNVTT